MYQSEIIFNGEDYFDVIVTHGSFETEKEAVDFGNRAHLSLTLINDELIFAWSDAQYPEGGTWPLKHPPNHVKSLKDSDIVIQQIPEDSPARESCVLNPEDFETVDIAIANFKDHPGLSQGFESIAYGVKPAKTH